MKKLILYSFCLLVLQNIFSCNGDFEKAIEYVEGDSTYSYVRERKVLYLIADGVRGNVLKDVQAPHLKGLIRNSIYSWNAITDTLANVESSMADLMTGVTKEKHLIYNYGFSNNELDKYPSIITRYLARDVKGKVSFYSYSNNITSYLGKDATISRTLIDDEAISAAVIEDLKQNDSKLIVAHFGNVQKVGEANSYNLTDANYVSSIKTFDQQLGTILMALRDREQYSKEDWLIVVTSSKGGQAVIDPSQNDNTIFSNPKVNSFTIIHTTGYSQRFVDKPFTGNRFTGSFLRFYSNPANNTSTEATSVRAVVSNNNNLYNFGDTTSFTIELKVRKNIRGTSYVYDWPMFFSKKQSKTQREGRGWGFAWERNRWRFLVGRTESNHSFVDGLDILDGNWHTLSVVVFNRDFRRVMRSYQDGKYVAETILPADFGTFDNPYPLAIGFRRTDTTHPFDGFVSDIRIWKAALREEIIQQYSCYTSVPSNHPNIDFLIGNWQVDEGQGLLIKDRSPANNDFHVAVGTNTTLQWIQSSHIICPPANTDLATLVPRSVDLPRQILSWLTISTPEAWGLDGKVWAN